MVSIKMLSLGLCFIALSCIYSNAQMMQVSVRWYGTIYDHDYLSSDDVNEYDQSEPLSMFIGQEFQIKWAGKSDELALQFAPYLSIKLQDAETVLLKTTVELKIKDKLVEKYELNQSLRNGQKTAQIRLSKKKDYATICLQVTTNPMPSASGSSIGRKEKVAYADAPDRGDSPMHWGICKVSIPFKHKPGALESPVWYRWEFQEKPSEHVMILETRAYTVDEFFNQMQSQLNKASSKNLLVYVHGFQTTFEEAAKRSAQITHDIKFPGITALFSWPSYGKTLKYQADRETSEVSIIYFRQFLCALRERTNASAIHIIAYSMGNQILLNVLHQLAADPTLRSQIKLGQVIFAAPDVQYPIFKQRFSDVLKAPDLATHYTLYASQKDKALYASDFLNSVDRAGAVGADGPYLLMDGIDVIDVSAVDTNYFGHDYHASNSLVLEDISELICTGSSPQERRRLSEMTKDKIPYWKMEQSKAVSMEPVQENYWIVDIYYATNREEALAPASEK